MSLVLAACSDSAGLETVTASAYSDEAEVILSINRARMSADLAELGRSVAIALGEDEQLQEAIWHAMSASPIKENKLEFATLVRDVSVGLGRGMAASRGLTETALLAKLDSVVPLELYFPVDLHRSTWTPGGELLVVTMLDDDQELFAYNEAGERVVVSMDHPPSTPALALVPAEQDFRSTASGKPNSAPIAASVTGGGVLRMTASYQPDTHEPWPIGDPELYIHVSTRPVGSGGNVGFVSCAGDAMDSAYANYYFDQNGSYWSGSVWLTTEDELEGREAFVSVWEDDANRCDGKSDLRPYANTFDWTSWWFANYVTAGATTVGCVVAPTPWFCLGALEFFVLSFALVNNTVNDDFVGLIAGAGGCFTEATGPVRFYLKDEHDNSTGAYIDLDDDFIDRVLCDPGVSIAGDTYACTGGRTPFGSLHASVFAASGGVTYKWYEDGVLSGTSSAYQIANLAPGTRHIAVEIIRAHDGATASSSTYVPVYDTPPAGVTCEE